MSPQLSPAGRGAAPKKLLFVFLRLNPGLPATSCASCRARSPLPRSGEPPAARRAAAAGGAAAPRAASASRAASRRSASELRLLGGRLCSLGSCAPSFLLLQAATLLGLLSLSSNIICRCVCENVFSTPTAAGCQRRWLRGSASPRPPAPKSPSFSGPTARSGSCRWGSGAPPASCSKPRTPVE